MLNRVKPFTMKKRERICGDDVRANLAENRALVESGIICFPEERKAYLVVAEALRRAGLCFDNSDSKVYRMADGIVLAVAHCESTTWTSSYVLDDECASHLRLP